MFWALKCLAIIAALSSSTALLWRFENPDCDLVMKKGCRYLKYFTNLMLFQHHGRLISENMKGDQVSWRRRVDTSKLFVYLLKNVFVVLHLPRSCMASFLHALSAKYSSLVPDIVRGYPVTLAIFPICLQKFQVKLQILMPVCSMDLMTHDKSIFNLYENRTWDHSKWQR